MDFTLRVRRDKTWAMGAFSSDPLDPIRRIAKAIPGAMNVGRWLRRNFDPEIRTINSLQGRQADRLFQPRPETWEDRYPQLFDALAQRIVHIPEPRILSFGCSTGAEVRSLRRRLPNAHITGIDINPRSIAKARRADTNPLSRYTIIDSIALSEQYDVILAMAVFRHCDLEAERPIDCTSILPFRRFAEAVTMLDNCLVPGGWLAIYHSHFRFADTPVANGYEVDSFRMRDHQPMVLLYGQDDRRIMETTYDEVLFHKN